MDGLRAVDSAYKFNLHLKSPHNISESPWDGVFLPIFSSHDIIAKEHHDVRTAIVALHGYTRNAASFFSTVLEASSPRNNTIVIVPYFPDYPIDGQDWGVNSINNTLSLHWKTSNWMKGANNSPRPTRFTSSFDALDFIVALLQNRSCFGSLEVLTLAGFSAGAQFLNRYSWASLVGSRSGNSSTSLPTVRFILSDASSYLYLSPQRPAPSCRPLHSATDVNQTCSVFLHPEVLEEHGDAPCPAFDKWKHGISEIPTSGYSYLSKYAASNGSAKIMKDSQTASLRTKDVRFIFGLQDACNCNTVDFSNSAICFPLGATASLNSSSCTPVVLGAGPCCDTFPDSTTNFLSSRCEDMVQGAHRLQRGLLYVAYLEFVLWRSFNYSAITALIPGMSHNKTLFFTSDTFQQWAYSAAEESEETGEGNEEGRDSQLPWRAGAEVLVAAMMALCVVIMLATERLRFTSRVTHLSGSDADWLAGLSQREGKGGGAPEVMMVSTHGDGSNGGRSKDRGGSSAREEAVGLMVEDEGECALEY